MTDLTTVPTSVIEELFNNINESREALTESYQKVETIQEENIMYLDTIDRLENDIIDLKSRTDYWHKRFLEVECHLLHQGSGNSLDTNESNEKTFEEEKSESATDGESTLGRCSLESEQSFQENTKSLHGCLTHSRSAS